MSEKYCLSWNDFKDSVSRSFGLLREEKDFFDVTLVTQDEVHLSAHKVVLSASSQFFKNILRKSPSNHPMIYLGGIDSKELGFIMDYVYQGEVKIYQEQLDKFLECASKLKIEGLVGDVTETKTTNNQTNQSNESSTLSNSPTSYFQESFKDESHDEPQQRVPKIKKPKIQGNENSLVVAKVDFTGEDLSSFEQQLEENIEIQDGLFTCKMCGKSAKQKIVIKNHIEANHLTGLSFPCTMCSTVTRSRNALRIHKMRNHI